MVRTRVLLVVIAIAALATFAHADSNLDPTIVIRDPVCPSGGCMQVGTHFTFGVPSQGFGTLFFSNASGVNWTSLLLTEVGVAANLVNCSSNAFAGCTVSTINGVTTIFLSGISKGFPGIPAGQNFSILFGCVNGACWPGGLDFTATANVPEPATMALMLTGLAGIVTRRRWQKRTKV
jgi:hypothetical protein